MVFIKEQFADEFGNRIYDDLLTQNEYYSETDQNYTSNREVCGITGHKISENTDEREEKHQNNGEEEQHEDCAENKCAGQYYQLLRGSQAEIFHLQFRPVDTLGEKFFYLID